MNIIQVMIAQKRKAVKSGICPRCGKDASKDAYRDEVSRRESKISGLCQACQDALFGAIKEMEERIEEEGEKW